MGQLVTLKLSAKDRAAIVDEFGDAAAKVAAFKPTQARYEQLAAQIRGWYGDKPADQEYSERGSRYVVTVQPRALESSIDAKGVHKKLGIAKFLLVVGITIKALEAAIGETEAKTFITKDRTGSRRLVPLPLVGQSEDAAA